MPDLQIPSGFISVCKRVIDSDKIEQAKNSDIGQLLKSAFMAGPSNAVATFGKVLVSDTDIPEEPGDDSTESSDAKQSDTKSSDAKSSDAKQSDTKSSSSNSSNAKSSDSKSSSESYNNYTIAEAYLRYSTLYKKYEAEDEATSDNAQSSFTPGAHIYVMSLLPNEGCTKWHLLLDASVESKLDDIKTAIKSKKFKLAYQLASNNTKSDGLVVVSAETFLNSKADCKAPFIGKCQFAFDSGSTADNTEVQAVCLAIAPLSAKNKKPRRETVYKVTYNIVGDITDGDELDDLMSSLKAAASGDSDNSGEYDPDEATDQISEYLHKRLKCKGDSSMYTEFLKIREYIDKNIDKKSLELNDQETETPQSYAKVSALRKDLITY